MQRNLKYGMGSTIAAPYAKDLKCMLGIEPMTFFIQAKVLPFGPLFLNIDIKKSLHVYTCISAACICIVAYFMHIFEKIMHYAQKPTTCMPF